MKEKQHTCTGGRAEMVSFWRLLTSFWGGAVPQGACAAAGLPPFIDRRGNRGKITLRRQTGHATYKASLTACQGLQNLAHMVGVKLEMELSQAADHAFQGRIFSQRRVFELGNTRLPVKLFPG